MALNIGLNTAADSNQQELEHLLAKRRKIDAEQREVDAQIQYLASNPAANIQPHKSPIGISKHQHHHQRRSNVPRSLSSAGPTGMARHHSSERADGTSISRSQSQRSAPMARTSSRGSTSQRSGSKYAPSNSPTHATTPAPVFHSENPTMSRWTTNEPLSSYNLSHQPMQIQRSVSQRKPELQCVPEHDRSLNDLQDPGDFFANTFGTPVTPLIPSPFSITPNANYQLSSGSYNVPAPSTPSTELLTNATTFNSMSRTNSLFNEPLPESITMLRINSNASHSHFNHVDQCYEHVTPTSTSPCHIRRSSNEEQSQLLVGAGGASQFSHSLSSHFSSSFGEKMEKSQSNESTSSSSSSRNKRQLQVQIQLAASRPIMPKVGSDGNMMSRSGSTQSLSRVDSQDGQDKIAIPSKSAYQRPKHDRVHCKLCESHPDGFRGEHELRRHQDREHRNLVKKWICVEPSDANHQLKPAVPLSKCKACGSQKKKYGAYYNAAAHLRRAHFKPKTSKGRKGNKEHDEKRGGKAGGDWPSMTELKRWMKEVEVVQEAETPSNDIPQGEGEASDDEIESTVDEQILAQYDIVNSMYDNTMYTDPTPSFHFQPIISDVFGTQMTIDPQSQYRNPSMYNHSGQGSFPDLLSDNYANDLMAFNDPSFSSLDDPVDMSGHDFDNPFPFAQ